jgi:TolB protein
MKRIILNTLQLAGRLGVIVILLSGVVVMAPGAAAQSNAPAKIPTSGPLHVKIITDFVVVREGRGDGTPLVAQIPQGGEAAVIGSQPTAGWWQVQLADGRQGWVNGDPKSLQVIGADGKPQVNDDPPAAAPTGKIVFQTASGGPIYIIDADGSHLRHLTDGLDPALSPDGQWVAFARWGDNSGLYVIKADGTGERKVFAEPMVKAPSWSADGTQIAISHQNGGHIGNYTLDLKVGAGGGPGGSRGGGSAKAGGKSTVAVQMPADARWKIGLVRVADGYFTDLASHDYSYSPSFATAGPDKGQIAYASDKGIALTWENAPSAVTRDPNTGTVSTFRFNDRSPVWSPDGARIAFQYKTGGQSEIFVMNADGTGRMALTHQAPFAETLVSSVSPVCSPDGTQVAYLSNPGGVWDIWVVDATGDNPHPLFKPGVLKDIEFEYNNVDERVLSWR